MKQSPIANRRHVVDTRILTIDPGKFNSVLCWYDTGTRNTEFRSIRTGNAETFSAMALMRPTPR